jgi:hypothetical protein
MTLNFAWQELYRIALIELRPEELPRRIAEAEKAILQRIAELRSDDCSSTEEFRALDDALLGLRALAMSECPQLLSAVPQLAQSEVIS